MSWIQHAKAGDDVVCIKVGSWAEARPGNDNLGIFPEYGEVYVISHIDADQAEVFLGLVGIDGWYWSEQFRPAQHQNAPQENTDSKRWTVGMPVRESV